jgi:hypothetical protein
MSDFWTQPRIDMLCALWSTKSASQVAAAIGDGCNRNMVIGKVNRLGLSLSPEQLRARQVRGRPARPKSLPRYGRRRLPRGVVLVECDGASA